MTQNPSRDAKTRLPEKKLGNAALSASTSKRSSSSSQQQYPLGSLGASSSQPQYPSRSSGRYTAVPQVAPRSPLPSTRESRSRLVKRELRALEREAFLIREELYLLERMPPASAACKELVVYMETHADPFVPEATGTTNEGLERARSGCFCWRPH
ncbi:hypothetical protein O6H91_06G043200 [Diphasiastrum complanatum]|uniref:Uncharacterized protein n=1 Tax=Diphasiastrum complanatum TaxID=34168 RepID=A0ACC2DCS2_DIPCM|nr:hypothetical protein O6H91_Y144200 [Diphasiastrum complanatum]KAJ7552134.1 hypothetical protein O6H91_06G043200 [Diphasiastrum complanatum]